jgi:tetratricopeptide (TPR) repeat protein
MLASIHWEQRQLDEAKRLFLEACESAVLAHDARLAAMTNQNLGMIASVRGEDVDALGYYEAGLSEARGAGLVDEVMKALINVGTLHMHMRRYDAAQNVLNEALSMSKVVGDLGLSVRIGIYLAELRLRQDRLAEAKEHCESAKALAREIGDTQADGEAAHVSGLIARREGEIALAEEHFLRAETISLTRKDIILQGETARELAEMYRTSGRNRETLQRLNQAHRLFNQLRARRELADVDRRTAQLESDFLDVVRKWGESIESKDIYTQGHCVRVADLSCAL